MQPSSLRLRCPLVDTASAFFHKRPKLVCSNLLGLNRLHLLIVNQLPFGSAGSNNADNGAIRQATGSAQASQTAAFTVVLVAGFELAQD